VKLYNSIGPNPRLVRMFIAEKGLEIPKVEVDLMGGENRQSQYLAKNPAGQTPALELDDGTILAETLAICEYLEERYPDPPLIGTTPEERAQTRMWARRVEFKITAPMADAFRFGAGLAIFKDRIRTIPDAVEDLKAIARDGLEWLDGQLEGRDFICGSRFGLVDILLYAFVEFGAQVGQKVDAELKNVAAWSARVAERPATKLSA